MYITLQIAKESNKAKKKKKKSRTAGSREEVSRL